MIYFLLILLCTYKSKFYNLSAQKMDILCDKNIQDPISQEHWIVHCFTISSVHWVVEIVKKRKKESKRKKEKTKEGREGGNGESSYLLLQNGGEFVYFDYLFVHAPTSVSVNYQCTLCFHEFNCLDSIWRQEICSIYVSVLSLFYSLPCCLIPFKLL